MSKSVYKHISAEQKLSSQWETMHKFVSNKNWLIDSEPDPDRKMGGGGGRGVFAGVRGFGENVWQFIPHMFLLLLFFK